MKRLRKAIMQVVFFVAPLILIFVAVVFQDAPFVRRFIIGPYGLGAVFWAIVIAIIAWKLDRR